ncbi:MAG: SRPBCC family protein [Saprospiraceae bacterium]|nr:SRPBCC family protein [Saprospiraceae bacterium]
MKYTVDVIINKDLESILDLFDNEANLYKWMEGLQKFEHISGTPGAEGSQSKMYFKMGKREFILLETIISKQLPGKFECAYDADGVRNVVISRFIALTDHQTQYISEQEFHFKGLMKFFSIFLKSAFKKQSLKYLLDFKKFAESKK